MFWLEHFEFYIRLRAFVVIQLLFLGFVRNDEDVIPVLDARPEMKRPIYICFFGL